MTTTGNPHEHERAIKQLGLNKRGSSYLCTQLIHGARAARAHFAGKQTATSTWVRQLTARAHPNVVVAVAAKLARIAWAVLHNGRNYEYQGRDSLILEPGRRGRIRSLKDRWLNGRTGVSAAYSKCGARHRDLYEALKTYPPRLPDLVFELWVCTARFARLNRPVSDCLAAQLSIAGFRKLTATTLALPPQRAVDQR